MNIKLLNSWLKDYLKTDASPAEIAEKLSLSSVSIERVHEHKSDHFYDIEITTNRIDLAGVLGIAREAAAVLPEHGIETKFTPPTLPAVENRNKLDIDIQVDPKLVNRVCAVVLEFTPGASPEKIQERLSTSEINPHNNVIDVTNYLMREIGHPMHAFDYDKITSKKMIIRESKKGEKIVTLDEAEYELLGGDIVIDDGKGEIIDLVGIKGTLNSSISDNTTRVLLFVDNSNPHYIRKTSMGLGIRTDAAQINEKGPDPEAAMIALLRGVELMREIADAKVLSEIVDLYPNKPETKKISVSEAKINSVIGVDVPLAKSAKILTDLGFEVEKKEDSLAAIVPSFRVEDVTIAEDLIEEIARVYGYHKLPNLLPVFEQAVPYSPTHNQFYWEQKTKEVLKYLGFSEVYTYSLVAEDLLEAAPTNAIKLANPLDEEHLYMRTTLVPSLLLAARENISREELKIFELANVYLKRKGDLPQEKLRLAGIVKQNKVNFLDVKGEITTLLSQLGIENVGFRQVGNEVEVRIGKKSLGQMEILDEELIDFEFDFEILLAHANTKKIYKPISHFPESIEDLRFEIDETIPYEKIEKTIREVSELVKTVSLLDVYQNKKTFRIIYQSEERNLTNQDLTELREKIIQKMKTSFKATHI